MPQVALESVSRIYPGGVRAVDNLDLQVADGELLVLVGPSGCGKTTTLRLIAGLDRPDDGTIRIGSRVVNGLPPRQRDVAMVFQNPALHPHLTVTENMTFGSRLRYGDNWARRIWWRMVSTTAARNVKRRSDELATRLRAVARTLGIEDLLNRHPHQLSGGERQRVALAKAIVREPAVLLLDEPLSNLDAPLRADLRRELKELHSRAAGTMVYVTHDQEEALALADRVAVLDRGRLQQVGRPEEVYGQPANRLVAGFIGTPPMNFFPGVLRRPESTGTALQFAAAGWTVPVDLPAQSELRAHLNKPIVLGLRPRDIHLRPLPELSGQPEIEATIRLVEPLGASTIVHLCIGAAAARVNPHGTDIAPTDGIGDVVCQADSSAPCRPGERTALWLDMHKSCWFDAENGRNLCRPGVPSTSERPAA